MMQKTNDALSAFLSLGLFLLFGLTMFWMLDQVPTLLDHFAAEIAKVETNLKGMY